MGRHLHIFMFVLAFGLAHTVFGELVVYPKPSSAPSGSGFTVKVQQNGGNWITIPLYPATFKTEVRNGVTDAWCYFDFSGTVTVQITVDYTTLSSYWLLPDSTGFSSSKVSGSTKNGNTVTYTLSSSPKQNVFVVNQNYGNKALYILANQLETNAPTASSQNVIYYGPGYHTIDNLTLTAGKTLYIAGGAVVKAKKILIEPGDDNITIRGRGILEPSTDEVFIDCKDNKLYNDNFKMEGVIISDWGWHRGWTTRLWYFQNTLIENIKIIRPGKYSADGFDFHHFNKVTINKCFVANCDDAVSPKAFWDGDDNQFLYVNDMVLFSTNNNGLLATYEGLSTVDIHDFYFKNCDVVGFFPIPWVVNRQGGYICFIANNGGANIYNISMENIRVYYNEGVQFACIRPSYSFETTNHPAPAGTGKIRDFTFKNIVANQELTSKIFGWDNTRTVSNVKFINYRLAGSYRTSASSAKTTIGNYTSNITFTTENAVFAEPDLAHQQVAGASAPTAAPMKIIPIFFSDKNAPFGSEYSIFDITGRRTRTDRPGTSLLISIPRAAGSQN